MKIHLLDPAYLEENKLGHYSGYLDNLAYQLAKENQVEIIGKSTKHRTGFSIDIWGRNESISYNIENANQIILKELEILHNEHKFTNIFVPNITPYILDGVIDFISTNSIHAILVFRYQIEMYESHLSNSLIEKIQDLSFKKLIAITSDSESLANKLQNLLGVTTIYNLPVPITESNISKIVQNENFYIDTFGNARSEKGIELIMKMIEEFNPIFSSLRIKFRLQVNDPENHLIAQIAKLQEKLLPNIEFIENAQVSDEYISRLQSTSLALLPYDPDIYRDRTSGVLVEVTAAGKPSLVLANTWLEKFLMQNNVDLTVENTTSSLFKAIMEIFFNYSYFKEKFKYVSNQVLKQNSYVELASSIVMQFKELEKKRVIIFYPWGHESLENGGAGKRVLRIAESLQRFNCDVTVIYPNDTLSYSHGHITTIGLKLNPGEGTIHESLHNSTFDSLSVKHLQNLLKSNAILILAGTHLFRAVNEIITPETEIFLEVFDLLMDSNNVIEWQQKAIQRCICSAISYDDLETIQTIKNSAFYSMPNLKDLPTFLSTKNDRNFLELLGLNCEYILFVGSNYPPNFESFKFLLKSSKYFGKNLKIVVAGNVYRSENWDNLISLGFVSDVELTILYRNAICAVNPCFTGTGVATKTVEALRNCKLVITTKLGSRGLKLHEWQNLVVVETDIESHSNYFENLSDVINANLGINCNNSFISDRIIDEISKRNNLKLGSQVLNHVSAKLIVESHRLWSAFFVEVFSEEIKYIDFKALYVIEFIKWQNNLELNIQNLFISDLELEALDLLFNRYATERLAVEFTKFNTLFRKQLIDASTINLHLSKQAQDKIEIPKNEKPKQLTLYDFISHIYSNSQKLRNSSLRLETKNRSKLKNLLQGIPMLPTVFWIHFMEKLRSR